MTNRENTLEFFINGWGDCECIALPALDVKAYRIVIRRAPHNSRYIIRVDSRLIILTML